MKRVFQEKFGHPAVHQRAILSLEFQAKIPPPPCFSTSEPAAGRKILGILDVFSIDFLKENRVLRVQNAKNFRLRRAKMV